MVKKFAQAFSFLFLLSISLQTALADEFQPFFKKVDCVYEDVTTTYNVSTLMPYLTVGKSPSTTDYTTIADAITNSSSGYRILICPGVYEENLSVDHHLKFIGLDGNRSLTIVDGTASDTIFEGDSFVDMSFRNLTLQNGYSSTNGGAIDASGDLTIENVSFKWNEAEDDGGAIENTFADAFNIENSEFLLNTAGDTGGAIHKTLGARMNIGNTTFSNNHAVDGGAIYSGDDVSLGSDDFTHNTAESDGGAVYVFGNCEVIVENSSFHANSAVYYGGALKLMALQAEIRGTTFDQNFSGDNGGGIFFVGDLLDIEETEFRDNTATGDGGGIYSSNLVDIRKSLFSFNEAENGAAAYLKVGGIKNSTFYWNEANNEGGAIYQDDYTGYSVTIDSSTLTRNTAASDGGALFLDGSSDLYIKNSILASNYVGSTAQSCNTSVISEDYNLETENTCGFTDTNDLTNTSPGFDSYGYLGNHGGFTMTVPLSSTSPAKDSGSCVAIDMSSLSLDQRNFPRPSGSTCDRGAYEYQ